MKLLSLLSLVSLPCLAQSAGDYIFTRRTSDDNQAVVLSPGTNNPLKFNGSGASSRGGGQHLPDREPKTITLSGDVTGSGTTAMSAATAAEQRRHGR